MTSFRTAIITGGVSGLGKATAIRLEADGIKVVTFDIADGADLVVDVTDADAVQAAADDVGPVDILINSAGIVGPTSPL
ncbi:hypothetical protein AB0J63_44090 [Streptosporangium canum]|uniref:hypothetical protein n=1 Tax=Streptosporangium canum TaxID=324952 RepID=UPI00341D2E78